MIDTKIRQDSIMDLVVCDWLSECDPDDDSDITDHEVLFSDYDLDSALQYDIFLRRGR